MKEFLKQPFVQAILITLLIGGGMYVVFEAWLSSGSTMDMEMDMNQSMEEKGDMEGMDH